MKNRFSLIEMSIDITLGITSSEQSIIDKSLSVVLNFDKNLKKKFYNKNIIQSKMYYNRCE